MRSTFLLTTLMFCSLTAFTQEKIRVGAKHFNEGYILAEILSILLEENGFQVERKFNLGGTAVTFEALRTGAIDLYPEYTGTIAAEILKSTRNLSNEEINSLLASTYSLRILAPYGFNNTYALIMREEMAKDLDIRSISDLKTFPELRVGLSYEFIDRADGWSPLAATYGLAQQPTVLEHGLAYEALLKKKLDITDAYATDGEITRYNLRLLTDDLDFFPKYQAVTFYRAELPEKVTGILNVLSGKISASDIQKMNAEALFNDRGHREIARSFLVSERLIQSAGSTPPSDSEIFNKLLQHIRLTFISLVCAVLIAVPLGMWIYNYKYISNVILYTTGILQTIPSIALLALMIPIFGIGAVPALVALFIYALLPILRNTISGMRQIDPHIKQVATALGLNKGQRLLRIEIPLAFPIILTGIRTAAVINVGTATLAAFIGAGGLGDFIVTGLALNNTNEILKGAIPAALLAVGAELFFEGIEWLVIPAHLRQKV